MSDLIEQIPSALERVVRKILVQNEAIRLQLKGAFKEALVCTDRRVMIAKSGFMTGNTFGSDVFQLPYSNVASAQVKKHLLTGYFEISAGGVQNTRKSYWSQDRNTSASQAPNCISLVGADDTNKFRTACAFIMDQHTQAISGVARVSSSEVSVDLDRLWKLKTEGALSQAEYEAAKRKLLGL
jgi:hypothetical protein